MNCLELFLIISLIASIFVILLSYSGHTQDELRMEAMKEQKSLEALETNHPIQAMNSSISIITVDCPLCSYKNKPDELRTDKYGTKRCSVCNRKLTERNINSLSYKGKDVLKTKEYALSGTMYICQSEDVINDIINTHIGKLYETKK